MLAAWLRSCHRVTQCEHQWADCADAGCPLMICVGEDGVQVAGVTVWTHHVIWWQHKFWASANWCCPPLTEQSLFWVTGLSAGGPVPVDPFLFWGTMCQLPSTCFPANKEWDHVEAQICKLLACHFNSPANMYIECEVTLIYSFISTVFNRFKGATVKKSSDFSFQPDCYLFTCLFFFFRATHTPTCTHTRCIQYIVSLLCCGSLKGSEEQINSTHPLVLIHLSFKAVAAVELGDKSVNAEQHPATVLFWFLKSWNNNPHIRVMDTFHFRWICPLLCTLGWEVGVRRFISYWTALLWEEPL